MRVDEEGGLLKESEVIAWATKTFPYANPMTVLAHLWREVEELQKAVADGDAIEARGEIGDCSLLLMHLAHFCGTTLAQATGEKFAVVKERKWGEPDAEGVVEHIREERK